MKSLIAIQEGQIPLVQIKALEAMLRQQYARHVGWQKLTVIWNVAMQQPTITDRKWSRSSACTVAVPEGFDEKRRLAFLLELDGKWREITGQHPDQCSFVAFNAARFEEMLKGNLAGFSPLGKALYLGKMPLRAFGSKLRHGMLITQFNQ